jgi:hypothetical protein
LFGTERTIPKLTTDEENPHEGGARAGRRQDPVREGEPGESYAKALRRWPNEVAQITSAELATMIGLSDQHVSALLQNSRRWRATHTLLNHALKIIEVCGGDPEDRTAWAAYHNLVAAYQVAVEKPPLPTPPEPRQFAARRAASDVTLATVDPAGDQPKRSRRRWALRTATWAIVFALLAWRIAYEPNWPLWKILITMAFAILLPMACLTGAMLLMAFAGPWLAKMTRRHQERSFLANLKDVWPVYALYLLVLGVSWAATPLFDVTWLSTNVKVLITGAVVITFLRVVQLQVQQVSRLDTAWPPTITPDTLTFRRAATRLHELLTTDQREIRDQGQQRQAESVLQALAEVRTVLTDRARMSWHTWLTGGQPNDPLPAATAGTLTGVVLLDCAGLVLRPWQEATARSVLLTLAVLGAAAMLAAVAITVSFRTHRRHNRRLADELRDWDEVLRPLVFPEGKDNVIAPTDFV